MSERNLLLNRLFKLSDCSQSFFFGKFLLFKYAFIFAKKAELNHSLNKLEIILKYLFGYILKYSPVPSMLYTCSETKP